MPARKIQVSRSDSKTSFTETERNLHMKIDRDELKMQIASDPATAESLMHRRLAPLDASKIRKPPGSTFASNMKGHDMQSGLQVRKRLLHEISVKSKKQRQQRQLERGQSSLQQPRAGDSFEEAPEVDAQDRIDRNAAVVSQKIAKITSSDSPAHTLAPFMDDITVYVETQLQALDRQFPPEEMEQPRHVPSTTILPQELAYRRAGCSQPTREETKRRLRVEIFQKAMRIFAESFKSYRLFLDALADEQQSYMGFLEEDLTLHKEVLLGMRAEVSEVKANCAAKVAAAEAERDAAIQKLEQEQKAMRKWKQLAEEQAVKDKSREGELKQKLMEIGNKNRDLQEESKRLSSEISTLTRQNTSLSIGTFTDSLTHANQQIAEWRDNFGKKEEELYKAHDDLANLSKDIRALRLFFQRETDAELKADDIRFTSVGMKVLFPELSRKHRLANINV